MNQQRIGHEDIDGQRQREGEIDLETEKDRKTEKGDRLRDREIVLYFRLLVVQFLSERNKLTY